MYDIIGDIHGHGAKLVLLLEKMGYRCESGIWSHPTRKLISLGDLVDRGPEQKNVVDILKAMQEANHAQVIMGNHEFNAVSWAYQGASGNPLREHSDKNYHQHKEFLVQADINSQWYSDTIEWFKTLPLFIETEHFCCIHAAWDKHHIGQLKNALLSDNTLKTSHWEEANTVGHLLYGAVEYCLKGPEIALPPGDSFKDGNGAVRKKMRLKWWDVSASSTYQTASISVPDPMALPNKAIPSNEITQIPHHKSVFFGHYWMTGKPFIMASNIACLDWSVVKENGFLVAYRFDGESQLDDSKLVWV